MSKVTQLNRAARRYPGAQNQHIAHHLHTARRCCTALARDGFVVEKVEVEGARPVVWIQGNGVAPARLGGFAYMTRRGAGFCETTFQAQVEGCRVQWISTDNGGHAA